MIVVSCQQLKKYHGANLILENISFELGQGDRAGLIGRNGSGKSTLMQMISGALRPDEGQLSIQKGARIGYLPQVPVEREGLTVYDVLALGCRDLLALKAQMQELEGRMSAQDPPLPERQMTDLLKRYAEVQEQFQREGGYEIDARIQQVANGLRIPPDQYTHPYSTLSGGEKTRVGLATLLIERPNLLLLDEPTNHLDTESIEWLETFLPAYDGALLVISHDRYFLDRVVSRVIELEDGEAHLYLTNYTGYVKEKEERLLRQFADYKEQQKRIKQMQETIRQLQEWGRIGANEKFFRRAASMQKALDRMEKVKRPVLERRTAEFDLQQADRSGREVLKVEGLRKAYGDRIILAGVDAALAYGEKAVLVGRNGAGKSTLVKLLQGQEQPDAGSVQVGARVEIGYLAQQERPDGGKTVLQAYCEEARVESGEGRAHLARYLFFGEDVFKSLDQLSGGEWTRLRLALLIHRKPNLLLLDEPTNHLDIASREALEEALEDYPGTVLAISHDRYFANRVAQRIWELEDGNLTAWLGNWDEYREKREQLRLSKEQVRNPAPEAAALRAKKPGREAGTAGQGRRSDGAKRAKGQIEVAIAQAEQRFAELEAGLHRAQNEGDLARLNELWAEREQAKEHLDKLYLQWMELEGETT